MSAATALTRVRIQGVGIIAMVFVAGVLAGAAIEHLRTPARVTVLPPPTPGPATQDIVANMKLAGTGVPVVYEALGLSERQREQIRVIMDANRSRTDSLLRTTWPALRALLDTVRRQVEQTLTAGQRAQLAAMRAGATEPAPSNRRER